ncbi:hypothetical protein AUJ69_02310 [Candidatus Woesearchaeota archaeon CG1_02_47_18]|nr:MAG: hypothetical protein AUJ69_02310 [Candidatus Woesearchaeota archaeon CG1_02_47_18]HII29631.1 class I SAM-dependent methyltransferase [Candidatus Woesearchaeota archaeon]
MRPVNQPPGHYLKLYFSKKGGIHHLFHKRRIDSLLSYVEPGSSLLDVGCGSGVLLYLAHKRRGCEVSGADIRPECVKYASGVCKDCKVYCTDVLKMKLDKQFDIVVCSDVIEHFTRDERGKILSVLDRHLKKGGRLILSFPSLRYLRFVEPLLKVYRRITSPGVVFDDEEFHALVSFKEVQSRLRGYETIKKASCCLGLINMVVLRK